MKWYLMIKKLLKKLMTNKYYFITFYWPWEWDWYIMIPKRKNWFRFTVDTPIFSFGINGWLFWGKKPEWRG